MGISLDAPSRCAYRTDSPRKPGGKALACIADTSPLFACPFCHNATLQYDRLPSVMTNVTRIIFLNHRQAMYACISETGVRFLALPTSPSLSGKESDVYWTPSTRLRHKPHCCPGETLPECRASECRR
jgi:hypothetical protein